MENIGENKRITEERRKATREVTSAVNNSSFKKQCEALIGAVANPETHTHTHLGEPPSSWAAAKLATVKQRQQNVPSR